MLHQLSYEQRTLADAMSEISEKAYCAGWMQDLEYCLWDAVQGGPTQYGRVHLSASDLSHLGKLATTCSGWITFSESEDEVWLPMGEWVSRYQHWCVLGRPTHSRSELSAPKWALRPAETRDSDRRLELAWERCKDWIREWDGAAIELLFLNVLPTIFVSVVTRLQAETEDCAVELGWFDGVGCDSVPVSQVPTLLARGDLANCIITISDSQGDLGQPVRILVDPSPERLLDLTVILWPDLLFPLGSDGRQRFDRLFQWTLRMEESLLPQRVFLAPENLSDPRQEGGPWLDL